MKLLGWIAVAELFALALLAVAVVFNRVAEDVRRVARHFGQKEAKAAKEEEDGHGHA